MRYVDGDLLCFVHQGSGRLQPEFGPLSYRPATGSTCRRLYQVKPRIGELPLGAHLHNSRGAGPARAYGAVAAGVTRLASSVGGLGGRPFAPGASGDIATEDLVYLLRDSGIGVDVDLEAAIRAATVARSVVGHDLPSALLRAGDRILN